VGFINIKIRTYKKGEVMKRLITLTALAFSIFLSFGGFAVAEEREIGLPKINEFNIKQSGKLIKFFISYSGVDGGIKEARIIAQFSYMQGETYVHSDPFIVNYWQSEGYFISYPEEDKTSGTIMIVNRFNKRDADIVWDLEYTVYIIDKNGNKSAPKEVLFNFLKVVDH
jgi:hypothetical protein